MHGARLLLRSRRNPALYWTLVLVLALLAAVLVASVGGGPGPARTRPVLVATNDIAPGQNIDSANTAISERPGEGLADDALTAQGDGLVASSAIAMGEPVLERRVTDSDPALGHFALAHDGLLALDVGDRVDILASPQGGEGPTRRILTDAPVMAADEASLVVGVDDPQALELASSVADSWLSFVRTPD